MNAPANTPTPELPHVGPAAAALVATGMGYEAARAAVDTALLSAALAHAEGRILRAAKLLKMPERTLRRHMRERGLAKEAFKRPARPRAQPRPEPQPESKRAYAPLSAERRAAIVADFAKTGAIKETSYNMQTSRNIVSRVLESEGIRSPRPRRRAQ